MTNLEDRLKLEAQIQAQEARSHRATVREIYQAVTGRTGEPGDWNGAKPVLALIEERDALRKMASEFGAALISARARVAELESRLSSLDCRYAGAGIGEVSGSHSPADNPCDRCVAERRVAELEAWQLTIAEGTGFINRAEGQDGYEVADPQMILDYLFKSNPEA